MKISIDDSIANLRAKVRKEAISAGQLTLGALIDILKSQPEGTLCYLCEPHSYRGFYDQLAFSRGKVRSLAEVLEDVEGALNCKYEGYKGGEFAMDRDTMVWIASYGFCGERLVGLRHKGGILATLTVPYE